MSVLPQSQASSKITVATFGRDQYLAISKMSIRIDFTHGAKIRKHAVLLCKTWKGTFYILLSSVLFSSSSSSSSFLEVVTN
jgi:hypothetical protein